MSISLKEIQALIPTKVSQLANDSVEPAITTKNTAFNVNFETTSTNIKMDGVASVGVLATAARADHAHPSDTTKAPLVSPALTGVPTAPTAAASTNTTQVATTAFVVGQINLQLNGVCLFVQTADPLASSKVNDVWLDLGNNVWKVNVAGAWKPVGAVYN